MSVLWRRYPLHTAHCTLHTAKSTLQAHTAHCTLHTAHSQSTLQVYPAVIDRLALLHIFRDDYHGGCFEGNQCSSILASIQFLQIPEEQKPFEDALIALRDLNIMAAKVLG